MEPTDFACLAQLGGQLLHMDAGQIAREDLHALRRAPHEIEPIAVGASQAETLGLVALPESSNVFGPGAAGGNAMHRRRRSSHRGVLSERLTFPLIELPHRLFERSRQPVEFLGRGIAKAALEQRHR
jgi:hypothetical protein